MAPAYPTSHRRQSPVRAPGPQGVPQVPLGIPANDNRPPGRQPIKFPGRFVGPLVRAHPLGRAFDAARKLYALYQLLELLPAQEAGWQHAPGTYVEHECNTQYSETHMVSSAVCAVPARFMNIAEWSYVRNLADGSIGYDGIFHDGFNRGGATPHRYWRVRRYRTPPDVQTEPALVPERPPIPLQLPQVDPWVEPLPLSWAAPRARPVSAPAGMPRPSWSPQRQPSRRSQTSPAQRGQLVRDMVRGAPRLAYQTRPRPPRNNEVEGKVAAKSRAFYAIIGAVFDAGSELRGAINALHRALPPHLQARRGALLHEKARSIAINGRDMDWQQGLENFVLQRAMRAGMGKLTQATFVTSGGVGRGLISDQTRVTGTRYADMARESAERNGAFDVSES